MNKWSPVILEEFGNQRKTKTIPKAIAHCKETFEGGSHDHGICTSGLTKRGAIAGARTDFRPLHSVGRGMVAAWERYNSTKSDTDPTKTKPVAELTKSLFLLVALARPSASFGS